MVTTGLAVSVNLVNIIKFLGTYVANTVISTFVTVVYSIDFMHPNIQRIYCIKNEC